MLREIDRQLDRLHTLGFNVTYLDEHMAIGGATGLGGVLADFAQQRGLLDARHLGAKLPASPSETVNPVEQLIAQIDAAPPGEHLVVGHPAYDDEEARAVVRAGHAPGRVARQRDRQRRVFLDRRALARCAQGRCTPIRYEQARSAPPTPKE